METDQEAHPERNSKALAPHHFVEVEIMAHPNSFINVVLYSFIPYLEAVLDILSVRAAS